MIDFIHLPNSPEEEKFEGNQEEFIRQWEEEQRGRSFLDMTLPELNKLMEETDDRITEADS